MKMILADTSVWIEHLRGSNTCPLDAFLRKGQIVFHPWVFAELSLGHLGPRKKELLLYFSLLPSAREQPVSELITFADKEGLAGKGLSLADVQLLSTAFKQGYHLWTLDKALRKAAEKFSCALGASLVK